MERQSIPQSSVTSPYVRCWVTTPASKLVRLILTCIEQPAQNKSLLFWAEEGPVERALDHGAHPLLLLLGVHVLVLHCQRATVTAFNWAAHLIDRF